MNTHFNLRPVLPVLLAGLMGLGTGCQTAKQTFSFQPLAHSTAAALPQATEGAQPLAEAAAPAAPLAEVLTATPSAPRPAPQPRHLGLHRALPVTLARHAAATALFRQEQRPLRHAPQAPAEQGLGLTVLGLLGMVAVVVGLIGIVVGGGPAWIVVATAGGVAVLLAYLIPKSQE